MGVMAVLWREAVPAFAGMTFLKIPADGDYRLSSVLW